MKILFAEEGRGPLYDYSWDHKVTDRAEENINTIKFVLGQSAVADYLKLTGTRVKIVGGKLKFSSSLIDSSNGIYALSGGIATKQGKDFTSLGYDWIWKNWYHYGHGYNGLIANLAGLSEAEIVDKFRTAIDGPKPIRALKRVFR